MALAETPGLELDHIVIAAKSLDEGARFIQEKLGTDIPAGGKHPLMGTHNCLMRLGSSAFLEVIAIDPDAKGPGRPRWYSLDDPALQQRLEVSPQLIAWVLRTRNIEHDALMAGYSAGDVVSVSRGTLSWRLTVPADGSLSWEGAFPHLIEWDDDVQPWEMMADRNAKLERLHIRHPEAMRLASILSKLMGNIPAYATISEAERPGLGADLNVDGRVATL